MNRVEPRLVEATYSRLGDAALDPSVWPEVMEDISQAGVALLQSDHLTDHRRLDTLAGAEEVDQPPVHARDKLCGKPRERLAATRIRAPPPSVTRQHCNKRSGLGDHPRIEHVLDSDRRPKGVRGVLRRPCLRNAPRYSSVTRPRAAKRRADDCIEFRL